MPIHETQTVPFAQSQEIDWVHPVLEAQVHRSTQ